MITERINNAIECSGATLYFNTLADFHLNVSTSDDSNFLTEINYSKFPKWKQWDGVRWMFLLLNSHKFIHSEQLFEQLRFV